MSIESVFIVGAGAMGSGIAQVCAQSGFKVFMTDTDDGKIERGLQSISWSLGKLVERGIISEHKEAVLSRIERSKGLSLAAGSGLVIEAVFENFELKRKLFTELAEICGPEVVISSNSSAFPITELGARTRHPERMVGIHFFNPAPLMAPVEVIKGLQTSEETMGRAVDFVKKLGKEPIRVERDVAGFLLNRINMVGTVEAIRLVEQGIGTIEEVDKGVRLAFGRKLGPFETGDLVGLDVSYAALMAVFEETKDMRYYPPRLLKRKVDAGLLGRKSGEGWYRYNDEGKMKR
jgi:3-hydroxybutyryl-CoA dehydrogenase